MKLPNPPALALMLGAIAAVTFWLLDADSAMSIGALACGIGYSIFYLIIQPRREE